MSKTNNISIQDAKTLLDSGKAILIDVRSPTEFSESHIACAYSVPIDQLDTDFEKLKIPADKKIITHCRGGGRGGRACLLLQEDRFGTHEVYNLEGGLRAWQEAGLPLISPAEITPQISIFRQVQMIVGLVITALILLGFLWGQVFFVLAGLCAVALTLSGITGWCGLAMTLQRMPWNNPKQ